MSDDRNQLIRLLEATLFASKEPIDEQNLAARLPDGADIPELLRDLAQLYANRGVNLVRLGPCWAFRTAPDLAGALKIEQQVQRRLSRAAVETLAIIAYHQPVTRAEIEDIRGVAQSRGTLDVLMEAGWVKPGRRRRTPGRPLTWVTTPAFLDQFGLERIQELPGIDELKAAGFLDGRPAIQGFRGAVGDPLGDEAEEGESADPEADADDTENEFTRTDPLAD